MFGVVPRICFIFCPYILGDPPVYEHFSDDKVEEMNT
jgi:hypothetical protein